MLTWPVYRHVLVGGPAARSRRTAAAAAQEWNIGTIKWCQSEVATCRGRPDAARWFFPDTVTPIDSLRASYSGGMMRSWVGRGANGPEPGNRVAKKYCTHCGASALAKAWLSDTKVQFIGGFPYHLGYGLTCQGLHCTPIRNTT